MEEDTGFEPVITESKSVALPDLANPLLEEGKRFELLGLLHPAI